jgi:hypothetical protein
MKILTSIHLRIKHIDIDNCVNTAVCRYENTLGSNNYTAIENGEAYHLDCTVVVNT